ncbi:hypothetical protein P170DRAFT_345728 [Aspergillus steynii IBT 23096]|uniref:Uncharacterized protein n=1 Tax=Aspergillus steynii IBT 23096 TaxID=1392250 RepID=A0A2I2GRA3_9EURO|nr:uncharacterized protein P170DRAFT_345728 [Aspergillus steynii IBT 23096]PLB55420.1 hypothetical protein P170DRAFT_345728 [Aspergillus steynii IBT 23096]
MAFRQQGLSRTLPKNFTFPSANMEEPRTPERASTFLDVPPPPPRHSSCRLRRSRVRSGTDVFAQAEYDLKTSSSSRPDIPLPSIEFPPGDASMAQPPLVMPASNDRFLAPPRDRVALKTPPAQIRADPIEPNSAEPWTTDDPQLLGGAIERPGSACSHASDSSVSSIETFASRRSVGGSCTSMESDSYDPFFHFELHPKPVEESPLPKSQRNKSRALPRKERWTLDMDNHLWNTYQLYLQNPTITPFKMTPGSIPPLGVTHRVARDAKKTWEKRPLLFSKDFISTAQQSRSGDSTPTQKADPSRPLWPKSEASTRRRLKLLCKRKFSIAPHYQRMMQSKSPTPALDLFSHPSGEPSHAEASGSNSTAYATRDLGVSLVSSSVPGPLAQLATETVSPPETNNEWFNNPVSHEPPRATDPFVNKPFSFDERDVAPPRLGSPFTYHTWGPHNSRKRASRHTPRVRRETIHVTGSRLQSPPRMDMFSGINRRQENTVESPQEQDTRRHVEELFRQGKLSDGGQRRVRIRNRGATTSSVSSKGLDQLFSPPSSSSRNEETYDMAKPVAEPLRNLTGESIKRLGSPFKVETFKRSGPIARFVRHAPSRSEPFSRELLSQIRPATPDARLMPQGMPNALPHDPTEQGISDAERIRRQILNLSHSRQ